MLTEALAQLAAAGGTAMVGAMVTDAWQSSRAGVARLLGRGDVQRQQRATARLDRTVAGLEESRGSDEARRAAEQLWTVQLEDLLADAPELADELRTLVERLQGQASTAAQQTWTQHNVAHDGGVQYITQGGDIHASGGPSQGPR